MAYEGWLGGTTSSLGPVKVAPRIGDDNASSSAVQPIATATGRRMTAFASRYQPLEWSESAGPRRIASALMRVPSSASAAGTTRTAITADRIPTTAPAAPIE